MQKPEIISCTFLMQDKQSRQLGHADHSAALSKYPLCLLLDNIEMPVNVGCAFRIADAFGLEKMFLTGKTAVPPGRKIKKASRSTEQVVHYEYVNDAVELAAQLKEQGYEIVALEITDKSKILAEYKPKSDKICLIVGSENEGIGKELLALSDCQLHIPMRGEKSSMNVASVTAIAVYEITKTFTVAQAV